MIQISLSQIAQVTSGNLIGDDVSVSSVSTDTRSITKKTLFIAWRGERLDGHDFCSEAQKLGASALIVERQLPLDLPQIVVKDAKRALGSLASWIHHQMDSLTVVITGSCGKTTVKEMTASILNQKGKVLSTAGNFNSETGVPLTLLRSESDDDYAVIELGANHFGEIAYTTKLAKPSVALVNNVSSAHLEGFGSLEGVKQAKGEIFLGLEKNGVAIINFDSHGDEHWKTVLNDKKVKTFSMENPHTDFYASNITLNQQKEAGFTLNTPHGRIDIQLNMIGKHNVTNAVAAAILTSEVGATLTEIKTGLENLNNIKGRLAVQKLNKNITLIDDSYNASFASMIAAVDLLSSYEGTRWLVLGNMAQLGDESKALHQQLANHATQFNFEHVLTYGDDAKIISNICQGVHFDSHEDIMNYIEQHIKTTTNTILIKGAKSSGMSNVVFAIQEKHS